MICGLNECIEEKGVEKVFKGDIAKKWNQKSEFVSYYGTKNPIKEEIMANACNDLYIADIGCGTGKMLKKIDSSFSACHLMGLDISNDMISLAQNRIFNGNNMVSFVNNDFMEYNFKDYYDIIIFSYVLHHMDNPIEALRKAKDMLSEDGKIIFSVPGEKIFIRSAI